jgi:hypothetical protein
MAKIRRQHGENRIYVAKYQPAVAAWHRRNRQLISGENMKKAAKSREKRKRRQCISQASVAK